MWIVAALLLALTLCAFAMSLVSPRRAAMSSMVAIFTAVFSMLIGADIRNAGLYDSPALPLSAVSSAVVTGGGCTPERTVVKFSTQEEVTVSGSMHLLPGDLVSRKVIGERSYVCRGDGHTVDCKTVE
ncbi:hypothetical protein AE923_10615 [Xanthomonas arboricola]|nr:hypothetical protein AE923_10615 [Xanthomonas arboricola]